MPGGLFRPILQSEEKYFGVRGKNSLFSGPTIKASPNKVKFLTKNLLLCILLESKKIDFYYLTEFDIIVDSLRRHLYRSKFGQINCGRV